MTSTEPRPSKILRRPAVLDRTGLSNTAMKYRIAKKTFPAPVSLGLRAVGWIEADVDRWITERPEVSAY